VFIYPHANNLGQRGYLIEHDSRPSEAPALLPLLKRYVLRSKVKIEDVSECYDVWAAWGCPNESTWDLRRSWSWAQSEAIEPVWDKSIGWPWGGKNLSLYDRRAMGMGRRMLVKKGDLREF